jgi:hypothetical protein
VKHQASNHDQQSMMLAMADFVMLKKTPSQTSGTSKLFAIRKLSLQMGRCVVA